MTSSKTIVFIHGLWIHTSSWQQWMDFFNEQGYKTLNPGWPGDSLTVAECRANSQSIANRGVEEIVESYAKIIATLPEPPIVIFIWWPYCTNIIMSWFGKWLYCN